MTKESLPPFGHALSGAAGAMLALAITYPVDVVKTRMQVSPGAALKASRRAFVEDEDLMPEYHSMWHALACILETEGLSGLYAGLPAGLLGTASSNFSYFFFYNWIRDWHKRNGFASSTAIELLLGAAAGALSQLTTIPVSVVITRQQTTPPSRRMSFRDTWLSIVRDEGVTGLWKGLKPSMVLVSNPAITYGMFERLKQLVTKGDATRALSAGEVFFIGAAAKTLATVVTYPLIMAKVKMQYKPPKEHANDPRFQYKGAVDVLRKVAKSEGLQGWYKGMQPQILKAVFSQALLFLLKDQIDKYTLLLFVLARGNLVKQRNR
ncbi:hypothetical protein H9P43_001208 [Blastocladiella emersonii ATCC 22665]|nr:hypothetical protein H9P43_001208 [Blastocladiella emersonii ATCC 22665]